MLEYYPVRKVSSRPRIDTNTQNDQVNIGRVGSLIVIAGIFGSALCGVWLDYSHTFLYE